MSLILSAASGRWTVPAGTQTITLGIPNGPSVTHSFTDATGFHTADLVAPALTAKLTDGVSDMLSLRWASNEVTLPELTWLGTGHIYNGMLVYSPVSAPSFAGVHDYEFTLSDSVDVGAGMREYVLRVNMLKGVPEPTTMLLMMSCVIVWTIKKLIRRTR